MRYLLLIIALYFSPVFGQDDSSLQETAKTFIRQGDYNNAILVLNRALLQDRDNLELQKDLAFTYYLQRDYVKALEAARLLSERKDADVQSFQILGMVYKAIEERKEADKMYKTALKKFPTSGVLYSEYGEIFWSKKEYSEAIKLWEKGIESDPNYSGNYYHAAKYYYFTQDKVWSVLYGEIFVNLESYSRRTAEMKTILVDSYKKMFSEVDLFKNQNAKNEFVKAYLNTMQKHAAVLKSGITPESLVILRTRFILDWFDKSPAQFPYRLFDYQLQLLKSGMFDAYNQWIFGAAKDLAAFQNWTVTHTDEYNDFNHFQKNRVFKLPSGQYYANLSTKETSKKRR